MQEDLRIRAVGDVFSDVFLHQICPVGGSDTVIVCTMFVGQSDTGRAWNKLQHQILDGHHYIQMISGALTSDENGVHSSGALLGWR